MPNTATQNDTLTWCSQLTSRSVELPSEFDTTSTVILIANQWRSLNADIHALEDRALAIHFDPSNDELHEVVRAWFSDHEVYDFIGSLLPYVPRISIRHYLKGKTLRHAGMHDWKETILRMLLPNTPLACVVRLQLGPVIRKGKRPRCAVHRRNRQIATHVLSLEAASQDSRAGDGGRLVARIGVPMKKLPGCPIAKARLRATASPLDCRSPSGWPMDEESRELDKRPQGIKASRGYSLQQPMPLLRPSQKAAGVRIGFDW